MAAILKGFVSKLFKSDVFYVNTEEDLERL